MANNILNKYGIKEVADVTFYSVNDLGRPEVPVLYLDTLKVSTIEQTAETTEARGGKGNPALIMWDYNKEINVTLEDALFSAKSMAIMFGNGRVKDYSGDNAFIMKTEEFLAEGSSDKTTLEEKAADMGWKTTYEAPDGKLYKKENPKFYTADNTVMKDSDSFEANTRYFCSFDLLAKGSVIEISANSFPGTYYVVGDTFARNQESGDDEFFQFIIPKAKVLSENTITLEAEGDPSVFNMSLRVLRPSDGKMMKLVKYNLEAGTEDTEVEEEKAVLIHNHELDVNNMNTLETETPEDQGVEG